ncbi:ATP-binding protein [Streptomyces sp. CBMA156]|uniref:ATP-binding protein n=1 Tax=Streptomyces sp. CBMA156 TaxID=1930280 RepID=UPI001661E10D|nr:ATP-binding protein [Streptomyces sp. CBMA156]MBD0673443.1 hypothetical protein [Streptomyces sp. CBMA156]
MNTNHCAVLPTPKTREVQPTREAAHTARLWVMRAARSWSELLSEEALRDVELCAAELITNSVEHTEKRSHVTVCWTGVRLRVEVADSGPGLPNMITADETATDGRGLLLVEALAHSWGWYLVKTGKVTWFEVAPTRTTGGAQPPHVVAVRDPAHRLSEPSLPPPGVLGNL